MKYKNSTLSIFITTIILLLLVLVSVNGDDNVGSSSPTKDEESIESYYKTLSLPIQEVIKRMKEDLEELSSIDKENKDVEKLFDSKQSKLIESMIQLDDIIEKIKYLASSERIQELKEESRLKNELDEEEDETEEMIILHFTMFRSIVDTERNYYQQIHTLLAASYLLDYHYSITTDEDPNVLKVMDRMSKYYVQMMKDSIGDEEQMETEREIILDPSLTKVAKDEIHVVTSKPNNEKKNNNNNNNNNDQKLNIDNNNNSIENKIKNEDKTTEANNIKEIEEKEDELLLAQFKVELEKEKEPVQEKVETIESKVPQVVTAVPNTPKKEGSIEITNEKGQQITLTMDELKVYLEKTIGESIIISSNEQKVEGSGIVVNQDTVTLEKELIEKIVDKIKISTSEESNKPGEPFPKTGYGEYDHSDTKVVELNNTNFNRAIEENQYVFVIFYAPWCSRSQTLLLEVEDARIAYNQSKAFVNDVLFAKVNCFENTIIRDQQSIGGYPVIQLYRRNMTSVVPRGPTHGDSLAYSIRKLTMEPMVTINTMQEYKEFLNVSQYQLIGLFASNETKEYQKFQLLSEKLARRLPIALIKDQELINAIYKQHNQFLMKQSILFTVPMENTYMYNDCVFQDVYGLFKWITLSLPYFNELTPELLYKLSKHKRPSVILFVNYTDTSPYPLINQDKPFSPEILELYKILPEYKKDFHFYFTDGISYKDFLERLGLTKQPSMAIINFKQQQHYLFDENKEVTKESASQFLNDYLEGRLTPWTESDDPNSSPNSLHVSKLVYNNFNQIINGNQKHSLVYFHEPWCGFCKTMSIYYDKAAEKLIQQFGDNLQIYDYDTSVNSIPDVMKPLIDGYPYIALFSRDDSANPIVYNGTRNVDTLVSFVQTHVKGKINKESTATTNQEDTTIIELQKAALEISEKEF